MKRAPRSALGLALLLGAGACTTTLPAPGPLAPPAAGPAATAGPADAVVRWSGGAVSVARPGAPDGFALTAFRRTQAAGGGWRVETGSAGRAEIRWGERGATLVLFERSRVELGDPATGGALARVLALTAATLELPTGERLFLPGGGELTNDAEEPGGPFRLLAPARGLVRVENTAAGKAHVRFQDAELVLGPLESVELATEIGAGSALAVTSTVDLGGAPVRIFGAARAEPVPEGLRVVADGPSAVEGLGARVRLEAGDEVVLRPSAGTGATAP